ncbi:hypothetical protein BGX29_001332, partial [Mortierella sp. GBA35]
MGVIDLDCIASNPNSSAIYGIGNAEEGSGNIATVLVRSNDNPSSISDINWSYLRSVSSGWGTGLHYKYSRYGDVDCAVRSSGAFTSFFYNPQFSVTGPALVPMGIQFNARLDPPTYIWGSIMYGWTSANFVHQSFYIEKDGVDTVVHAVIDETASVIRFGLVNNVTGHLQLAAVWKLTDGRFMLGQLTDNPHGTPTPKDSIHAPSIQKNRRKMFFQGARENSRFLGYWTNMESTTDGTFAEVTNIQTIGGHLPGQVPFAFGLTARGYFGMALDGPSMGNISGMIEGVVLLGFRSHFRNYNDQVVPGYYGKASIEMDSATEVGLIVGAIFGFFPVLALILRFNRWLERNRIAAEKRAAEQDSYELIAKLRHVSGLQPASAPPYIATTTTSANTTSHTLLDGLGLSRHPRPNNVTTIGDD